MIKISYGILCNDELNELTLLLELLILYIRDIDEVCVLTDSTHPNLAMNCLLYTSPSPRDRTRSRMPSSA